MKSKSIWLFSRFLSAIIVTGCIAAQVMCRDLDKGRADPVGMALHERDEAKCSRPTPCGSFAMQLKWAVNCNEAVDAACRRQRQIFREGVEALQRATESYKEGTQERTRLQRALHQILGQDRRQPSIAFAALLSCSATTSPDGKTLTFDVDSNAMNDARVAAGTIAEEGTHSADAQDPRRASLSPFSFEYRGKQANAWAAQGAFGASNGLAKVTRAGTEVVIWDPRTGHRATDEELKTQVLDGYNNGTNMYRETTPHDPWD